MSVNELRFEYKLSGLDMKINKFLQNELKNKFPLYFSGFAHGSQKIILTQSIAQYGNIFTDEQKDMFEQNIMWDILPVFSSVIVEGKDLLAEFVFSMFREFEDELEIFSKDMIENLYEELFLSAIELFIEYSIKTKEYHNSKVNHILN